MGYGEREGDEGRDRETSPQMGKRTRRERNGKVKKDIMRETGRGLDKQSK